MMFASYGEIDSIRVLHERFCAFVNFKNANMASRAMENLNVSETLFFVVVSIIVSIILFVVVVKPFFILNLFKMLLQIIMLIIVVNKIVNKPFFELYIL